MYKWNFDRIYLKEKLIECNERLDDPALLLLEKLETMKNIDFLKNMIKHNFSNKCEPIYIPSEYYEEEKLKIPELKVLMINACIEYLYKYGQRAINLIIKLYEDNIFYVPNEKNVRELSIEEQEEYTIKNYENNSKFLLPTAKEFLNLKHSHIQHVSIVDSYCYYSKLLDKIPFIVVNPEEFNSILNHELQHALEFIYGLNDDLKYKEIGSIYFELLFCDTLYEQDNKYSDDFRYRVTESSLSIEKIYPFFKFINILKSKKFDVTDEEFIKLCEKELEVSEEYIQDYIERNIDSGHFQELIEYLFSHLKAIDIREKTQKNDEDSLKTLMDNYKKPLTYNNLNEKVLVYKRYLSEIESKR